MRLNDLVVLVAIADFHVTHGYAPTLDEFAATLGLSRGLARAHLGELRDRGLLEEAGPGTRKSTLLSQMGIDCLHPEKRPPYMAIATGLRIKSPHAALGVLHALGILWRSGSSPSVKQIASAVTRLPSAVYTHLRSLDGAGLVLSHSSCYLPTEKGIALLRHLHPDQDWKHLSTLLPDGEWIMAPDETARVLKAIARRLLANERVTTNHLGADLGLSNVAAANRLRQLCGAGIIVRGEPRGRREPSTHLLEPARRYLPVELHAAIAVEGAS